MTTRKTTRIAVEIHEAWVIRQGTANAPAPCADCNEQLTLVTVDHAVEIARVSARAIYRLTESGQIHFQETPEGRLLVCLNSLL